MRPDGVKRPNERKPVYPVSLLPSFLHLVHGAWGRGQEKRGEEEKVSDGGREANGREAWRRRRRQGEWVGRKRGPAPSGKLS